MPPNYCKGRWKGAEGSGITWYHIPKGGSADQVGCSHIVCRDSMEFAQWIVDVAGWSNMISNQQTCHCMRLLGQSPGVFQIRSGRNNMSHCPSSGAKIWAHTSGSIGEWTPEAKLRSENLSNATGGNYHALPWPGGYRASADSATGSPGPEPELGAGASDSVNGFKISRH